MRKTRCAVSTRVVSLCASSVRISRDPRVQERASQAVSSPPCLGVLATLQRGVRMLRSPDIAVHHRGVVVGELAERPHPVGLWPAAPPGRSTSGPARPPGSSGRPGRPPPPPGGRVARVQAGVRVRPVDRTQCRQVFGQHVGRLAAGVLGDQREHVGGAGAEPHDAGRVAAAVADVLDVAYWPRQFSVEFSALETSSSAISLRFGSVSRGGAGRHGGVRSGTRGRGRRGRPRPVRLHLPERVTVRRAAHRWRAPAGTARCR